MAAYLYRNRWVGFAGFLTLSGLVAGNHTLAQITPDSTLGAEGSIVTPGVDIRGLPADLIEGGAVRESNLFHSFLEFNVGNNQRVYFASPAGIENILTRVTGTEPSEILGTLGVQGNANLFLLNPNGIIFGANAQLDIAGSLLVTTADTFVFDNGFDFSASNPQAPPLLTINLTPGLQYGLTQPRAIIANTGNLAVGQDLTLVADSLNLQGQLQTGGDLTLLTTGDVSLNSYQGTSLHIWAGGRVNIDTVTITGVETGTTGVDARTETLMLSNGTTFGVDDSRQPILDVRAGVSLAEMGIPGVTGNINVLNPSNPLVPTRTSADISIGTVEMRVPDGVVFLTNQYKPDLFLPGGMISVDTIRTDDRFNGFLGNSGDVVIDARGGIIVGDRIVTSSASGNAGDITLITKDAIALDNSLIISDTNGVGQGGNITLEAGSVTLTNGGQLRSNTNGQGDAGDVRIVANGQVLLSGGSDNRNSTIRSQVNRRGEGEGGDITIQAGSVLVRGDAQLLAITNGQGNAGHVRIVTSDTVALKDGGRAVSRVDDEGKGDAGGITIQTGELSIIGNSSLTSSTIGDGDAGDIVIEARDRVFLDGRGAVGNTRAIDSRVRARRDNNGVVTGALGDGGNITITTGALTMVNRARVDARTAGWGDAGNIEVYATDSVNISGTSPTSPFMAGGLTTDTGTTRDADGNSITGRGGTITVHTGAFRLQNHAVVSASTSSNEPGGSIEIRANTVEVTNGGRIRTTSEIVDSSLLRIGETIRGDAGNINIYATDGVAIAGANSELLTSTGIYSSGKGGNITIEARSLSVTDSAQLSASTSGQGEAGNIDIEVDSLSISNRGKLDVSTFGEEDAGDITVRAADSVVIANDGAIFSRVAAGATGNGAHIDIQTRSLSVIDGGRVETQTLGLIPSVVAHHYSDTPYEAAVQADNPVAYWHLNETSGSTAFDASGNTFNGIYQGGVTLGRTGVLGTAAEFDGISGAVSIDTIPPGSALDIQNQSFTVEAWVKPNDSPPEEQVYFGMHGNRQGHQSLHLRVYEDGSTRFGYWGDDLNTRQGTVTFGENWYHVVTRYDQELDTSTVFVNGRAVASGSQGPFEGNAPRLLIGSWQRLGNQPFKGLIDEVAVYNSALSPESIAAHYTIGQRNLGTPDVRLTDNGANAGNITVKAESITLSGVSASQGSPSGFFSGSEGQFSGQGGNINITTGSLRVADGAVVSTRSQGAGDAGNLDAIANFVELDNEGKLTAETAVGNGGNIRLRVQDLLLLRRNSEISTTAGKAGAGGDGGNITIDAGLIVAVPEENSDISADAFEGRGGTINITTQGIFGIDFRDRQTPLSDITASSQFGIDGNVEINSPDVDPSRGLAELPTDLVDAAGLVDRSCSTNGEATTSSSFTVTGRGGLPPTPDQVLSPDGDWEDWRIAEDSKPSRERQTESLQVLERANHPQRTISPLSRGADNGQQAIAEATGWVKSPNGQVMLVAQNPTVTSPWLPSPACQN